MSRSLPHDSQGCPGHYRLGRRCAVCLCCARLDRPGCQVHGIVERQPDGVDFCALFLQHETNDANHEATKYCKPIP